MDYTDIDYTRSSAQSDWWTGWNEFIQYFTKESSTFVLQFYHWHWLHSNRHWLNSILVVIRVRNKILWILLRRSKMIKYSCYLWVIMSVRILFRRSLLSISNHVRSETKMLNILLQLWWIIQYIFGSLLHRCMRLFIVSFSELHHCILTVIKSMIKVHNIWRNCLESIKYQTFFVSLSR